MPRPSRRTFLGGTAAAVGAAAATRALPAGAATTTPGATTPDTTTPSPAKKAKRTGTIKDVKHVVILMQENRAFDHYYGSLGGVRGFGDKQELTYPDGSTVFSQPDTARPDGALLPWHLDTTKFDAQEAGDLDHSWPGTHQAWNAGAWNAWVPAKGEESLGYFTRADVPWQYSLADAFTICDQYFCSIQGPTTPNRLYHWTGTIDPGGTKGGPAITNPDDYLPVYNWKTYPERLQEAGVDWRVYANDEVSDGGGEDGWVGDYGDNPLWLFQAYHDALNSADPQQQDLAERASLRQQWKPNSGRGHDVNWVLKEFAADCAAGTLPAVSWVVAPYAWCEHPQARPVDGATYTNKVLTSLWANPELWAETVVLINFDENDGFFDHVAPPFAPPGTAGEYVDGLPIGLGPRVPMTVVSPWSRGGWVNSEVFDHTSVLRFLEVFTGVQEPNISHWRREVCGDLTSCFDFKKFDASVPTLPDLVALTATADQEKGLPPVTSPGPGAINQPVPETATRKRRATPYDAEVKLIVDRDTAVVTVSVINSGPEAMGLSLYQYNGDQPFTAQPLWAPAGKSATARLDTSTTDRRYDFAIYGPNGFVRAFRGAVQLPGANVGTVPSLAGVTHQHSKLTFELHNAGTSAVRFSIKPNDFGGDTVLELVKDHQTKNAAWHTADGWYDVTLATDDGGAFSYRFAGYLEP